MIRRWISTIDDGLEKAERAVAVVLLSLLIAMICINILGRNIFHWTSHVLLELSPTVVLWLALVGATLALKHQRHIKIELLLRILPLPARRLATMLTRLFAMAVCGLLTWASVIFVSNEVVLMGAKGWLAVCYPIFFSIAFLRFSIDLLEQWHSPGKEKA